MVDIRWPSSSFDETNDQLSGLLLAEQTRSRDGLRRLEAAVARLDGPPVPDPERDSEPRERPATDGAARSASRPDPPPFVALPRPKQREFGRLVREKLTREALAKRGWQ